MTTENRILLFTGDGKGKTTAAMGMALRALGHDMRVAIFQFVKNDDNTGELKAFERFDKAHMVQLGQGFIPPASSPKFRDHATAARNGLDEAAKALASGDWDMVVLDEINIAVSKNLLDEAAVVATVKKTHPGTIVVLTGRGATAELIALADTVTEMQPRKHGFQEGIAALKGVEF